jgi:hypothetical protein
MQVKRTTFNDTTTTTAFNKIQTQTNLFNKNNTAVVLPVKTFNTSYSPF